MADERILYTEELVGANHGTKADTLNRLTLAWHDNDGSPKFHGAMVYMSANQTITDSTETTLSWDTEEYDTDAIHAAGSPTIFTIPSGFTRAKCAVQIGWAVDSTGQRRVIIQKNGAYSPGWAGKRDNAISDTNQNITTGVFVVTAGDTFNVKVYHTKGSNLDVVGGSTASWFAIELLK